MSATRPHATPRLSVICVTPDCIATLASLFHALRAQSIAKQLEVIIVGPPQLAADDLSEWREAFQTVRCAALEWPFINAKARTLAVGLASAPTLVFTEDHCFPEPEWAEALAAAVEAGADGAAPLMVSANSNGPVAELNFLLEYGPWSTLDAASRPQIHLPGHNSAYRRDFLPTDPAELVNILQLESPWLWEQATRGAKLVVTRRARSHHFNFSLLGPSLPLRFLGGRLFGACRALNWPLPKRLLGAAALPLIIALRWWRTLGSARQLTPNRGAKFHLLLPLLLCSDSLGEVVGYLCGAGDAASLVSELEFHRGRFTAGIAVVPPFLQPAANHLPTE
jgi:hypothetical protein